VAGETGSGEALPSRQVGQTDVHTTVLGLGGAPLGNLFAYVPETEARDTIAAAHAGGVRYFDTAPQYGHGQSEHRFGSVLRHLDRSSFRLSTKVGRLLKPTREPVEVVWRGPISFRIEHDYSYDATMRSIEASYHRLGMSRIDIALIHDVDVRHQGDDYDRQFEAAIGGAVRALEELKRSGEIGAIGIGVNEIEPCLRFAGACALDAYMLAGRHTLLEHSAADELFDVARRQGFSLLIAGPFNSGILATGTRGAATHNYRAAQPEILERVARIERVCAAHGVPLAAAAVQFPLARPEVASVVTGAVRPEEIAQNIAAMHHAIAPQLWADLVSEGLLDKAQAPRAAQP
jgi:D-threo-aldose 1-dehydrogenase